MSPSQIYDTEGHEHGKGEEYRPEAIVVAQLGRLLLGSGLFYL